MGDASSKSGQSSHPTTAAYVVALGAVAVALLLRWLLDPLLGDLLPLSTVYGAVAVAVWFGGYKPGLAAMLVGYLGGSALFIPPRGTLTLTTRDAVAFALYFVS